MLVWAKNSQTLTYAHAGLALWGSDVLALIVDVDEYVMTPEPGITLTNVRLS
jgi:hypothetical protein